MTHLPFGYLVRMTGEPNLPGPRGPLSDAVLAALGGPVEPIAVPRHRSADPLADDDLQLALYVCFELHYRSFAGVDAGWEWEPSLVSLRRELEAEFLAALRRELPERNVAPDAVGATLFGLEEKDGTPSLSRYLKRRGTLEQFREFMIHRSAYQLKEADPHTWAIPRLHGAPKAALVEVQADEYGSGAPDRVHATLFARSMEAVGLDGRYGTYLDAIPGFTLATVNLISAFGLNRAWRGALAGHLAMFEIGSPTPNARYAKALRRLGHEGDALEFFLEHVEADSVHENIAAYDLAQGLAVQQPGLSSQIIFGAEALRLLDDRFATRLIEAWEDGVSSLRRVPQALAA